MKEPISMNYNDSNVELNNKGINKNIHYQLLDDAEMLSCGFRKIETDTLYWYYCRYLDDDEFPITFNVILPIPVDNDNLDIMILDEAFGQNYDFQSILQKDPTFEYALYISNEVEIRMKYLESKGILSGHNQGDYI